MRGDEVQGMDESESETERSNHGLHAASERPGHNVQPASNQRNKGRRRTNAPRPEFTDALPSISRPVVYLGVFEQLKESAKGDRFQVVCT